MNTQTESSKSGRLLSLDAFRGFDMLFIMGLSGLIVSICALWPGNSVAHWIVSQMEHVQWNGLAMMDTIFPTFLFIAGISFPFSIAKQRANGRTNRQIYTKIIYRGIMLVFLGMVYNGLFKLDFANLRCASVLARIGLAWMFAALLFLNFKDRTLAILAAVLLVGYWLLMRFVPGVPDPYSFDHNLVGMIDRVLLPGKLYQKTFDPEGLFSVVPAIVTAMLGMFTGKVVRLPEEKISGGKKALYLFLAAIGLIVLGCVWNSFFPINKKLWSSSFVCVVGGYSLAMFSLFYFLIDVKGYRRWTLFFRVVGMNSITIYLAQRFINFHQISDFFIGGLAGKFPAVWANIFNGAGYIAACWLFLYFLYRKNVFLRV